MFHLAFPDAVKAIDQHGALGGKSPFFFVFVFAAAV